MKKSITVSVEAEKLAALEMYLGQKNMKLSGEQVGGQAVLGRQLIDSTPWLTERHGYDPT